MEAVGRLAGGVAHDFNNLLTVIPGYSEPRSGARRRRSGATCSRIQPPPSGRAADPAAARLQPPAALAAALVDLNAVVARHARRCSARLIGEDIELVDRLEPRDPGGPRRPGQLEQVILNLAVNARDAMPDGGRLTIETANVDAGPAARRRRGRAAGRYVVLGVATPASAWTTGRARRIFEPFFTTKEPGKGTGLGLATVYGIVARAAATSPSRAAWARAPPSRSTCRVEAGDAAARVGRGAAARRGQRDGAAGRGRRRRRCGLTERSSCAAATRSSTLLGLVRRCSTRRRTRPASLSARALDRAQRAGRSTRGSVRRAARRPRRSRFLRAYARTPG